MKCMKTTENYYKYVNKVFDTSRNAYAGLIELLIAYEEPKLRFWTSEPEINKWGMRKF